VAEALSRMLQASRRRQTPVAEIVGIGGKTATKLAEAGIVSLGDLLAKSAEELAEIPGLGEKSAERILEAARAAEEAPPEEESDESAEAEEEQKAETAEETTVRE
jgi:DNA-directed RNA polymerase alpha subunit